MFDGFSIDIRSIFDRCSIYVRGLAGFGGALEEHWRRTGGLEEDRRRVAGGLEKDWRRCR